MRIYYLQAKLLLPCAAFCDLSLNSNLSPLGPAALCPASWVPDIGLQWSKQGPSCNWPWVLSQGFDPPSPRPSCCCCSVPHLLGLESQIRLAIIRAKLLLLCALPIGARVETLILSPLGVLLLHLLHLLHLHFGSTPLLYPVISGPMPLLHYLPLNPKPESLWKAGITVASPRDPDPGSMEDLHLATLQTL